MLWEVEMAFADSHAHFALLAAAAAAVHTYFVPGAGAAVLLLMKQHAQCHAVQVHLLSGQLLVQLLAAVPVNLLG